MISTDNLDEKIKDMDFKIRQCYGAYSSLQEQMHSLYGLLENIQTSLEFTMSDVGEVKRIMREAIK